MTNHKTRRGVKLVERKILGNKTAGKDTPFKCLLKAHIRETVRKAVQSHDANPEAFSYELAEESLESRRDKKICSPVEEAVAPGNGTAFLSNHKPAAEDDLIKADRRIASRLGKALRSLVDSEEGGPDTDTRSDGQKYKAPKYENLESLLRYVESDSGQGVVKVVIMNFND